MSIRHLLFYLLLPTFSFFSNAQSTDIRVVTQQLQSTALTTELVLSGTLIPIHEAKLSMAADALVTALHVDVGSQVKRGDLLLELDSDLAKQQHLLALAQVNAAQIEATEAQRLWDEGLRLQQKSHIAQSEISARESNAKLSKAQLAQAQANARIAAEQLAYHKLYAPFDGVISARWTDLGQWLTRGDQVFTLVSLNNFRLDVRLPQEQLNNIKNLQSVNIQPDTQPELNISAQIETLVPVGDKSRSFLLRISTKDLNSPSSPALFPGTSAQAILRFKHPEVAVILPRDAVLRSADGNYSAFIIKNGVAHRRKITLGESGDGGYLVKHGVKAGEHVVIRGNELLSEGNTVIIINKLRQQP